jgi:hypothetical protein
MCHIGHVAGIATIQQGLQQLKYLPMQAFDNFASISAIFHATTAIYPDVKAVNPELFHEDCI